jgi:hypothetical protein
MGRLSGWKRYDRDTYMEVDIGELPPGEVMQIGNIVIEIKDYKSYSFI